MDEREADNIETPTFSRMTLSLPTECLTSTPRRKPKRYHEMLRRAKSYPNEISVASIEKNTALKDNQRQSLNFNICIENNPFTFFNSHVLSSTTSDTPITSAIIKPVRHGNRRIRLSATGKRRKSILNVRNAQTRSRMAFRSKIKQKRTERFLDQRLSPIENDKSHASHDADAPLEIDRHSESIKATRFEVLLADKFSEHPFELDKSITLNSSDNLQSSSANFLSAVTPEASNNFRSTKTSYSGFGLRKIPQIKQDKTPMRLTSSSVLPKIQLCDIFAWNRFSDSLKLSIVIGFCFLLIMYCTANCSYHCK